MWTVLRIDVSFLIEAIMCMISSVSRRCSGGRLTLGPKIDV